MENVSSSVEPTFVIEPVSSYVLHNLSLISEDRLRYSNYFIICCETGTGTGTIGCSSPRTTPTRNNNGTGIIPRGIVLVAAAAGIQ
mmetsp:Transcript_39349/g.42630  ORF Transcript_39349/g.42630 Transcript_39349/m.42630 type:complete len:86 (-) Transcript_39349:78-335(-)